MKRLRWPDDPSDAALLIVLRALAIIIVIGTALIAVVILADVAHAKPHNGVRFHAEQVYRGILPGTPDQLANRGFTRIKTVGTGSRVTIAVSEYWRTRGEATRFGTRYPVNALVIVTRSQPPKPAEKVPDNGEAAVRYWLTYWQRKMDAPSWVVAKGMHVAYGESRYNRHAVTGQHRGAFQMNDSWGSKAQRHDLSWSTRRFVKACMDGSASDHWAATW